MTLTPNTAITLLFLLGAGQGAFLAFALFTSRAGSRRANRYLGCYLSVFVLTLTDYALDSAGIADEFVELRTLLWPKEFFFGPFLYFYVRELTLPGRFRLQGSQWLHLAPASLHVLLTWSLLLTPAPSQARVFAGSEYQSATEAVFGLLLGPVELPTTIAHVAIYLVLSIRLLYRHEQRVKANFSYTEKVGLRWLRSLVSGTLAVYLIWVVGSMLSNFWPIGELLYVGLGIGMVLLIYSMGFLALRQPLIFTAREYAPTLPSALSATPAPIAPPDESCEPPDTAGDAGGAVSSARNGTEPNGTEEPPGPPDKYRNSALSADLAAALVAEATRLMEDDRLYVDNALSLPQLANRLGVSVNYLSQAINQVGGQNFFDFVSGFRIRAVLERLDEDGQETVLDLALDAGFNSKSAFYAAFRKHTGLTPGQYKKSRARAVA